MYHLGRLKVLVISLTSLVLNPVCASELISLGAVDEITANTRLIPNFKAHEQLNLLPKETVKTNPSRLTELKKKFLTRDLGPLTFKLNLYNPVQLSRNNLSVNLDLVESYNLLRSASAVVSSI